MQLARCGKCRDHLDEGDLFCPNCGHEVPARTGDAPAAPGRIEVHRFQCSGCGATLLWEAKVQALYCAFCGRATLEEQPPVRMPAPQLVVPLQVDPNAAERILRDWLGKGRFRPNDLRDAARLTEIRGVFLPYWSFTVHCDTHWTADSNHLPPGAKADWAPQFGSCSQEVSVLLPASGVLHASEARNLGPYDLEKAVPYSTEVLGDTPAEAFGVTLRQARLQVPRQLESQVRRICEEEIPGTQSRNLHLNPLSTGTTAAPVLLPVWILAYGYRDKIYRFLINGQTGEASGTAPVSPWKVIFSLLMPVILILLLLLINWILSLFK
jgi:predicted RNA-binding Zn-ribbon protein involved in translation (DUF1610 family)